MKKVAFINLLVLLLILGLVCSAGSAEKEKKVTLKVAAALPTRMPILDVIHFFAEKIQTASNGSIRVIVYDPGKLVPPFEVHRAVSTGEINAGYTAAAYVAGKIPAAPLFSTIPFGPSMTEYLAWFYEGNGVKLYQEMYDENGYNFKVFPILVKGMESGGWFRKQISSAQDLKGLRVRWAGLGGKVLAKLGASVSTIPGSEVFPALEKGAIDAVEWGSPPSDSKMGFWKVAPYCYFPGWHQSSTCVELIINKKTWDRMSKAQQTLIELGVMASNTRVITTFEAQSGKAMKYMIEKHGVKNLTYSDELLELFRKTWLEVVAEESAKDPFFKRVWDDLCAFRADYRLWECNSILALPRPECK